MVRLKQAVEQTCSVTEECEGWADPADGDPSNEDYGKNALTMRAVPSVELL